MPSSAAEYSLLSKTILASDVYVQKSSMAACVQRADCRNKTILEVDPR